jgi:hypothetical protein
MEELQAKLHEKHGPGMRLLVGDSKEERTALQKTAARSEFAT